MSDVILILLLLYMFSTLLNYSLVFAFFQRSGPRMYEAHEPARVVKDVKFSIAIAMSGFVGTIPLFMHIVKNTSKFPGLLLWPASNVYWKTIAHEQYMRDQQIAADHAHQPRHWSDRIRGGRDFAYSRRFSSYDSPPAPPRIKHERADNDTDGRCKSIWD